MRSSVVLRLGASRLALLAVGVAASASPAVADTWQGYYIGVTGGYGDHQARYEDPDSDWFGTTHQYHPKGALYGLQLGRNWQTDNVAMGFEADFLGSTISRNQIYSSDDLVKNDIDWMASLRARKGFAFGDTFIYETVGLGFADFERSWTEAADVPDSWPDLGDTKVGVVAGFGVERAIGGNWSVRTEAQVFRFFDNTSVNPDGFPLNIDDIIYTLRAGVNYSFGGNGGSNRPFVQGKPFDFSGFFVGASLGGHMATVQLTDVDFNDDGSTYDLLSNGFVGGIQGGYNTQIEGFVYGLEANVNFYDGDDTTAEAGAAPFNFSGLNWSGDVKFKAGTAADNTMMYLVGGYAFADYDLSRSDGDIWDLSGTHSGFIVGTGIEHAFTPNVTGRFEATYSGIGGDTSASPTNTESFRGAAQDVTLMAGINYYLGERGPLGSGALAPVDWRGFYVGADGVFAYHQGSMFDRTNSDHGANYTLPSFGGGVGLHAGHDWQDDAFVYGLIADVTALSNEESDNDTGDRVMSSSLNWLGTLRGRAGIATGQALFFASGGLAYADAELDHSYIATPADSFHFDNSRWGWTIGLGVEKQMSDRSSFKFETLYTKFSEVGTGNGSTCSDGLVTEPCEMLGYDDTITISAGYSLRWGADQ